MYISECQSCNIYYISSFPFVLFCEVLFVSCEAAKTDKQNYFNDTESFCLKQWRILIQRSSLAEGILLDITWGSGFATGLKLIIV
jgi:hypothetical protein